jgi:hypothetical protein
MCKNIFEDNKYDKLPGNLDKVIMTRVQNRVKLHMTLDSEEIQGNYE